MDDDSRPETKKFSERQWKRRSELKNGGFDEDLIGFYGFVYRDLMENLWGFYGDFIGIGILWMCS